MSESQLRILIADSDLPVARSVAEFLEASMGCSVTLAGVAASPNGDDHHRVEDFAIVFVDQAIEVASGYAFLTGLGNRSTTSVIISTSIPSIEEVIQAFRHGAVDVLFKPYDFRDLEAAVQRAAREHRQRCLRNELLDHKEALADLLGWRESDVETGLARCGYGRMEETVVSR